MISVAYGTELRMIKQLSKRDSEKASNDAVIGLFVILAMRAEKNQSY